MSPTPNPPLERLYESPHVVVHRGRLEDGTYAIFKALRGPFPPPEEMTRLRHEFEILSRLEVPGVVRALSLDLSSEPPVLVLEDIGARSLDHILRDRRLDLPTCLHIGARIARVIDELHRQHTIHKDINPSNILWNPESDELRLADFGIATTLARESAEVGSVDAIEGTLAYMSPEQTGRMNRVLDARTDLYSFGATLYEMLTGSRPYASRDSLELVHSHIALRPTAPHERDPKIPRAVSDVAMRLLAKNAEDRYQTGLGVAEDLERCAASLAADGTISPFELAVHDVTDKLRASQKLYGRAPEITSLLDSFTRVADGAFELLLVNGPSGIGKTALVREVHKLISGRRANFISGKFEQFRRGIPYASLIQALQQLIRQIGVSGPDELAAWRTRLSAAAGRNLGVLIQVMPELEHIVGDQPPVSTLPAAEAENRFLRVMRRFVGALASADHPLVLFLDDLQWADLPSIRLLESVGCDGDITHLLLIGAYRENEVTVGHPLLLALDEIGRHETALRSISLGPLTRDDVHDLVADLLRSVPATVAPLADLSFAKTLGNPFFLIQFIEGLGDAGLLRYEPAKRRWDWDIDEIGGRSITDNVVEFMAERLRRLASSTAETLSLAACIGARFDASTLAHLRGVSATAIDDDLAVAVEEDLVLPIERQRAAEAGDDRANRTYAFVHDRIHEAAYTLLDAARRTAAHGQIGRLLARRAGDSRDEHIFAIVDHLNRAIAAVDTTQEREEYAELNLVAATRARRASAYQPALTYVRVALQCADQDLWLRRYPMMLALNLEAAEAAFLCAEYDEMEERIESILHNAHSVVDQVRAYEIRIQAQNAQNELLAAVQTAVHVVGLLGSPFPDNPGMEVIMAEVGHARRLLAEKTPDEVVAIPEADDRETIATMRLLAEAVAPAYYGAPNLMPIMASRLVSTSLERGMTLESPFGLTALAVVLCSVGEIEAGYDMGRLALRLAERFEHPRFQAQTVHIFNTHVRFWKEPYRASVEPLREAYRNALDQGDFKYAAFASFMYCNFLFLSSPDLDHVLHEMEIYTPAIHELGQVTTGHTQSLNHQVVSNLTGDSAGGARLAGPIYDEAEMLAVHEDANDRTNLLCLYSAKTALALWFRDFEAGAKTVDTNMTYLDAAQSTTQVTVFHFHAALVDLAACGQQTDEERRRRLDRVAELRAKLDHWAQHAPVNNRHRVHLIDAESARVSGDVAAAMDGYEAATRGAREAGYLGDEALANELAARCFLDRGNTTVGSAYLRRARHCYARWGAAAKVAALDAEFPELEPARPSRAAGGGHTVTTSLESLDLMTVLKASQAMSGEIILDRLLDKMMRIVIENAGAESGHLVLTSAGGARVRASARIGDARAVVNESIPLRESESLAVGVVEFVLRRGQDVVLADAAADGDFTREPYIQKHRPRSVLCSPILHLGEVSGAVYLENNLASGAFTPERLQIVHVLASQAAISIQNSSLYNSLTDNLHDIGNAMAGIASLVQVGPEAADWPELKSLARLTKLFTAQRDQLATALGAGKDQALLDFLAEITRLLATRHDAWCDSMDALSRGVRHVTEVIGIQRQYVRDGIMAPRQPLSLKSAVDDALVMQRASLADDAVVVDSSIGATLPHVSADRTRLVQVLVNMLKNACEAMHDQAGERRLRCTAERSDDGAGIRLTISDNGPGFSPQDAESLFERGTSSKGRLSGSGLYNSRQIIESFGGRLRLESDGPGRGARALIELQVDLGDG